MTSRMHRRDFVVAALGTALLGGCGRRALGKGVHYEVAAGDSLSSIARRAEIPISSIVEANDLRSRHLEPGQRLLLPGTTRLPKAGAAHSLEAQDVATPYRLVPRRQWGAKRLGPNHDPMHGIHKITLHHTAEIPGRMHQDDRELVKVIQRYHQSNLGWADIGYHYLIGRDGKVYEGRPLHAQGAHCGGSRNRHNLGIALIGDFHRHMPSRAQLAATESFVLDQLRRNRVHGRSLIAHREIGVTICPGDQFYEWFTGFRRQA